MSTIFEPEVKKDTDMKWFDTQEIKNKDTLSPEQIDYIKNYFKHTHMAF